MLHFVLRCRPLCLGLALCGAALAESLPPCPAQTHAVGKPPPGGFEWHCENAAGVAEGPWLRWYDDGRLMSESQMKNGREHGRQRAWWPNGQLMLEGISVDGNRYKGFKYWGIDGTPSDLGIQPRVIERKADPAPSQPPTDAPRKP